MLFCKRQSDQFHIIRIIMVYLLFIVQAQGHDWTEILSMKIKEEVKSAFVVTFGSLGANDRASLLKMIDVPSVNFESIDGQSLFHENYWPFNILTSEQTRSENLFMISKRTTCVSTLLAEMDASLSFIVQLFFYLPRPKSLLVLDDEDASLDKLCLRRILLLAWHHQFLNFSVITVNGTANIFNYNPFSNTLRGAALTNETEIFPDKLQNMHGWTLNFPLVDCPPSTIVRKQSGSLKISGHEYPYFPIFAKALNFKLNVMEERWEVNSWHVNHNKTGFDDLFADETTDGMTVSFVSNAKSIGPAVTLASTFFSVRVVVLVPIMRYTSVESPWEIYVVAVAVAVLVGAIHLLTRFTSLPRPEYGITDMYRSFLGLAASSAPSSRLGKLSLASIFVVSLVCSSGLFTKLTDSQLVKKDIELDSFEQIEAANLTLYLPVYFRQVAERIENAAFRNLLARSVTVAEPASCLARLQHSRSCVCVAMSDVAEYYIARQGPSPAFKISKLTFHNQLMAFPFRKGSPYVDRISELQRTLVEAGISKIHSPLWAYEVPISTGDSRGRLELLDASRLLTPLAIVAVNGFALALLTFAAELTFRLRRHGE
ncbi:uncharacterized protein LOC131666474 [Phymastichus coffea]|uniref:uncharacterized protein LOC131666474 n=1 Tax=Phymastichus coffea TaxID=108790 RepID=UPI00273CD724|nr:uncharacterized protein LOC131666474 [Phymastichus coffea]